MTRPHYSGDELWAFIDRNAEVVDIAEVAAHVANCERCAVDLAVREKFQNLIADPIVWKLLESDIPAAPLALPSLDTGISLDLATRAIEHHTPLPPEGWAVLIERGEVVPSEALVEMLVLAATRELDRAPARALEILRGADAIACELPSKDAQAAQRGDVTKNEANALRMQGRYDEALMAAERAFDLARSYSTGAFAAAQARYTRATVLLKLGRYGEAAEDARLAAEGFAEFGDERRIAHSEMLEAAARTEQGDLTEAREVYASLVRRLMRLGDDDTLARATANLAVCELRLNELDNATAHAHDARRRYRAAGNDAERIRTDWVLAAIAIARGEESAVQQLMDAATAFEAHGMIADAGFVRLDLVEEYLRRGSWAAAAELARQTAETFTRSGARLHVHRALAYLQTAVREGSATLDLVRYIRSYITVPEASGEFAPPT